MSLLGGNETGNENDLGMSENRDWNGVGMRMKWE